MKAIYLCKEVEDTIPAEVKYHHCICLQHVYSRGKGQWNAQPRSCTSVPDTWDKIWAKKSNLTKESMEIWKKKEDKITFQMSDYVILQTQVSELLSSIHPQKFAGVEQLLIEEM